jgi:hypothetical protein
VLVEHSYNPSYLGAKIGRIMVPDQPRHIVHETPSLKITRAKWTGGVGSSNRMPALQAQSLENKPWSHQITSHFGVYLEKIYFIYEMKQMT